MPILGSSKNDLEVHIKSTADKRGFDEAKKGIDGLSGSSDEASRSLGSKLGGALKTVGKVALVAGAATGALAIGGLGSMVRYSFNATREVQQYVAGIRGLTKNSEEASDVIKSMVDYVQGKPFDRIEVLGAARQLLTMGRSAKQVKSDIELLGRAVVISGKDWSSLSRIYGKVSGANRLMNDDIMILEESIPIVQVLAKQLGVTGEEVRKMASRGEIDFARFKKALEESVPASAVESASQTIDNRLLSLKASFRDLGFSILGVDFGHLDETGQPLVKPGGLLDRAIGGVEGLTGVMRSDVVKQSFSTFGGLMVGLGDRISEGIPKAIELGREVGEYLGPKLVDLGKVVRDDLIPVLGRLWKEVIEPLAPVIGTTLVAALGLAIDATKLLLQGASALVNFFLDNQGFLAPIIGAFAGLKTAMMLNSAFAVVTALFTAFTTRTVPPAITKMGIFKLLVTTPMAMPAIAVGAALASLGLVIAKAIETKNVIEETTRNIRDSFASMYDAKQRLIELTNTGTMDQQRRAQEALKRLGYASGGFTGRGPADEIAGIVHRGEYVVPKHHVDQSTGLPKAGQMLSQPAKQEISVTYNVYNQVDLEAGMRELSWRLSRA